MTDPDGGEAPDADDKADGSKTKKAQSKKAPSKGETQRRAGDRRTGDGDRRAGYDRRSGKDRRTGERRTFDIADRRPAERRINEYPLTDEELEFINAVDHYKKTYNKPFPTWSEILHIVKSLGYEKRDD